MSHLLSPLPQKSTLTISQPTQRVLQVSQDSRDFRDSVQHQGMGTEKRLLLRSWPLPLSLVTPMASSGTIKALLCRPDSPGPVTSGPCTLGDF